MIDLAMIVARIQSRLDELGLSAAEVSLNATDSKDTIRNWMRAVKADADIGSRKASATTIKLNQIEAALGIVLAQNAVDGASADTRLRSALLAYGVDHRDLGPALKAIRGFVAEAADAQSELDRLHDRSERANLPRE